MPAVRSEDDAGFREGNGRFGPPASGRARKRSLGGILSSHFIPADFQDLTKHA